MRLRRQVLSLSFKVVAFAGHAAGCVQQPSGRGRGLTFSLLSLVISLPRYPCEHWRGPESTKGGFETPARTGCRASGASKLHTITLGDLVQARTCTNRTKITASENQEVKTKAYSMSRSRSTGVAQRVKGRRRLRYWTSGHSCLRKFR